MTKTMSKKKKQKLEYDALMSKTMRITEWVEKGTKRSEPEEMDAANIHGCGKVTPGKSMKDIILRSGQNDDINIDNDSLIHMDLLDMEVSKEAKEQEVNRDKPESEELEIVNDKETVGKDCWAIVFPVVGGEQYAQLRNQCIEQLDLAVVVGSNKSRSQVEVKSDNTGKVVDKHEVISVIKGHSGDVDGQVLVQHDHGGGEEPLEAEEHGQGVLDEQLKNELQSGLNGGKQDEVLLGQGVHAGQVDLSQEGSGDQEYQGGRVERVEHLNTSDMKRASAVRRRGKTIVLKNQFNLGGIFEN